MLHDARYMDFFYSAKHEFDMAFLDYISRLCAVPAPFKSIEKDRPSVSLGRSYL